MKYSVFTVSVPEMTPDTALRKMKEYGYDGVDFRVTDIPTDPKILAEAPSYWRNNYCTFDVNRIVELAPQMRALCDKHGLTLNALATYLDCKSDPAKIEACMMAAQIMGCSRIRVNCVRYDPSTGYDKLLKEALEGFEKVERLARKYNVKADLEMHHGTISASASAAYRIASHFDPQYIGVIYDTGNIVFEGLEQYQMGLEVLGKYLDLVHVKNAAWTKKEKDGVLKYTPDWAPFSDGFTDFEAVFKALHAVGYDGYITIEDFNNEPSDSKLKNDLAYLKKMEAAL